MITSSVAGHQVTYWEPVYSASKRAVHALAHGIRRQLIGTGGAAGTWVRSKDVADAVLCMLTRPSHVNIRDLVILPVNQEI